MIHVISRIWKHQLSEAVHSDSQTKSKLSFYQTKKWKFLHEQEDEFVPVVFLLSKLLIEVSMTIFKSVDDVPVVYIVHAYAYMNN